MNILGILCQKQANRPEELFFDFNGNMNNTGSFSGVTTTVTDPSGSGSVSYISGLAGAGIGQALDINLKLLTFTGTGSLAVGNISWEFGCYINPLYKSQPLIQKRSSTTGWSIYNYYGSLYISIVGGSNSYGQAVATLNSSVTNKLKIVYNHLTSATSFYVNNVLITTHTGVPLVGVLGDLFSYGGTGHSYIDDMYFKLL